MEFPLDINRRTKIIATLGPATDNLDVLSGLIKVGVDVVRINCSHGSLDDLAKTVQDVRKASKKSNQEVAILFDLQGPKIRIAKFKDKIVRLEKNQKFILDSNHNPDLGDEKIVGLEYKPLPNEVKIDDVLLLDDGKIVLKVLEIKNTKINCLVLEGGFLSNNKGLNKFGGGLAALSLTDQDKEHIKLAAKLDIDYLAISFPKNSSDIKEALKICEDNNFKVDIIAKIERKEALDNLDDIIKISSGVMVARGDLGVEIGDAELPGWQKHIINRARALDKFVITATQMMETMITNSIPTRAEVFDVANAVLDGTDAVMLSAETATGHDPIKVVMAMSSICLGAEKQLDKMPNINGRVHNDFTRCDEAVAFAAIYVANHMNIKAIIVLTETGATALWMSRAKTSIPIYALSRHVKTRKRVKLYKGVYPLDFDVTKLERSEVNKLSASFLVEKNVVKNNDYIIIVRGDFLGISGGANTLKVLKVGEIV